MSLAASVEEPATQIEQLQRQAQQTIKNEYDKARKSAGKPVHIEVKSAEKKATSPGNKCWPIDRVKLEGAKKLFYDTIRQLQDKYSHQCIDAAKIQQLMSELTAIYIQKGYVAARVYLPEQDLTTKVLNLLVVEGKVESIRVDGDPKSVSIGSVLPGTIGKPLNLRDIEQALEQINRLSSNNASFQLEPGTDAGDSIVVIKNKASFPWHFSTTYDNTGATSTGKYQLGVSLGVDNLAGLNDYLYLSSRQSVPYHHHQQSSDAFNITYILPYGYSTWTASASESKYYSPLYAPSGNTLTANGYTEQSSLRWDYMLYRGQIDHLTLSQTVTNKNTKSYLEGVLLQVSSRRLTIYDLDLQYSTYVAGGRTGVNFGYSKGLKTFGALDDASDLPETAPKAQFEKFRLSLNYFLPFKMADQAFSLSSQWVGQYAEDRLYGSEQISIGGLYTVRGFRDNSIAGDRGFYSRNDLSWSIPGKYGDFRPFIGFDFGQIKNIYRPAGSGALAGAAIGMGYQYSKLSMDLTYTHPLDRDDAIRHEGGMAFFTLNLKL